MHWQASIHQSQAPIHPRHSGTGRAENISQSADGRDRVEKEKIKKQKVIELQETGLEGMSGGWIDCTCVILDRCDLKNLFETHYGHRATDRIC